MNDDLAKFMEAIKPLPSAGCTCLIGTSVKVADPWCPKHKIIWEYVSPEQEND